MGIMVVVFALLAIVNPLIGASYLVYTLSFAILMLGLANIFVGWKLRKVKLSVKKLKTE